MKINQLNRKKGCSTCGGTGTETIDTSSGTITRPCTHCRSNESR